MVKITCKLRKFKVLHAKNSSFGKSEYWWMLKYYMTLDVWIYHKDFAFFLLFDWIYFYKYTYYELFSMVYTFFSSIVLSSCIVKCTRKTWFITHIFSNLHDKSRVCYQLLWEVTNKIFVELLYVSEIIYKWT